MVFPADLQTEVQCRGLVYPSETLGIISPASSDPAASVGGAFGPLPNNKEVEEYVYGLQRILTIEIVMDTKFR